MTPSADWSERNTTIAAVQSMTPALEPSSGLRSVIWFSAKTCSSASASSDVAAGSGPRTPSATPIPAASAARPTQYTVTLDVRGSFMRGRGSGEGGKASVRLNTPWLLPLQCTACEQQCSRAGHEQGDTDVRLPHERSP